MSRYGGGREQFGMLAVGALFVLGITYVGAVRLRRPGPLSIQSVPYGKPRDPVSFSSRPDTTATSSAPVVKGGAEVVVDVVGAVRHPGVQRLAPDARVEQAVQSAGGATAVADLERVNLAEKLVDGEMIRVPKRGENPGPSGALPIRTLAPPALSGALTYTTPGTSLFGGSDAGTKGSRHAKIPAHPVSLNLASAEELETLPGIGPATAQKIIEYRNAHGAFNSVDELSAIKGLGEKKRAKLSPYVRL